MKYRKKPVVVDATQWFKNGDHPEDNTRMIANAGAGDPYFNSEGKVVRYFRRPDVSSVKVCAHCHATMNVHGWIDTKEGGHIVCPGDFIITGVQGERYPCKADIFAATYEPAAPGLTGEAVIEHRNDLSLIFERAEIRVLITDHCARRHDFELGYDRCEQCMVLRAHLANAIIEWRDGCELLAASQEQTPDATCQCGHLMSRHFDFGSCVDCVFPHYCKMFTLPSSVSPARHGKDCPKAPHGAGGFMHLPEDDGPYDVDGVTYCGRCHAWIEAAVSPAQQDDQ